MMSSPVITFGCGHSCDFAEVRSLKNIRCPKCAREAQITRGKNYAAKQAGAPRNQAEYAGRIHNPLVLEENGSSEMERSSLSLLKAIYRAHPYVFDAAERQGRKVVRP